MASFPLIWFNAINSIVVVTSLLSGVVFIHRLALSFCAPMKLIRNLENTLGESVRIEGKRDPQLPSHCSVELCLNYHVAATWVWAVAHVFFSSTKLQLMRRFNRCWWCLVERTRAAWWEETLLFAASLARNWSHSPESLMRCCNWNPQRRFTRIFWRVSQIWKKAL